MIDQYQRNIDYLRISITDKCNMRCFYCMPENGVNHLEHDKILSPEHIKEIVEAFASLGIKKVRITGGEPLVRNGVIDICRYISAIKGIEELCLTTNGSLLDKYATLLKDSGVKRLNISLDTLDEKKYRLMSRGGDLNKVLNGIKIAQDVGFKDIKINAVLIKEYNDDEVDNLINFAAKNGLKIRFIELMPIGPSKELFKEHYLSTDSIINSHPQLKFKSFDGVTLTYLDKNTGTEVGFISPLSHSFCGLCSRIRLTADGMIKPCLHSPQEVNIFELHGEELKTAIKEAIYHKPKQHNLNNDGSLSIRDMSKIGG